LRNLASRFLRQQVLIHFDGSVSRLDRIAAQTQELSDGQRKHVMERIRVLRRWERTGRRILPLALAMLGGD